MSVRRGVQPPPAPPGFRTAPGYGREANVPPQAARYESPGAGSAPRSINTDPLFDVIGGLLLVLALFLPWDYANRTYSVWYADVAIGLALAAIAVPYLIPMMPESVHTHNVITKRLLMIPVGIAFGVNLVVDLLSYASQHAAFDSLGVYLPRIMSPSPDGGTGTAVSVMLLGAALVVVPRRNEKIDPSSTPQWDKTAGFTIATGLILTALATLVAVFRGGWARGLPGDNITPFLIVMTLLMLASLLIAVGLPLLRVFAGRREGRLVLFSAPVTFLVLSLIQFSPDPYEERPVVRFLGINMVDSGILALPIVIGGIGLLTAAIALAPRAALPEDSQQWLATARLAALLIFLLSGVESLIQILGEATKGGMVSGVWHWTSVLVTTALAAAAYAMLMKPSPNRNVIWGLIGGVALFGIVRLVVPGYAYPVSWTTLMAWFPLAALTAYALARTDANRAYSPPA